MVCGEGRRERRTDQKAQCPCCCQIADGEAWKTARLRHALSLIDRVTHRVDSSGRRRIGRCYVATFIRISLANGTPPIAGRVGSSSTAVSTKQEAMSLRQTFTSRRQYSPEGRRLRTITASLAKAVGVGRWRHGGPLVADYGRVLIGFAGEAVHPDRVELLYSPGPSWPERHQSIGKPPPRGWQQSFAAAACRSCFDAASRSSLLDATRLPGRLHACQGRSNSSTSAFPRPSR